MERSIDEARRKRSGEAPATNAAAQRLNSPGSPAPLDRTIAGPSASNTRGGSMTIGAATPAPPQTPSQPSANPMSLPQGNAAEASTPSPTGRLKARPKRWAASA